MNAKYLSPLLFLFSVFISGCATTSTSTVSHGPSIAEAREASDTNVDIRWGGEVIKINNHSDYTLVELISRPLNKSGKPNQSDSSEGRFLVRLNEFLDPENIKPGRRITVWGNLREWQTNKIGEYDYLYPVVAANQHKIWPKKRKNTAHSHYYDPFWDGPVFGGSWWHRDHLYFNYN